MATFPRIGRQGTVDPLDWVRAVDYVNRVNWLFETYDLEGMISSFQSDANVYHFHGDLHGEDDIRNFLTHLYPYLIPGVSRNATNHIVDVDGDGWIVRYQNLLVRYATPEQAVGLGAGEVMDSDEDLPGIWLYSPMIDRLRFVDGKLKIFERYIGGSTTNTRLSPVTQDEAHFTPFMPNIATMPDFI